MFRRPPPPDIHLTTETALPCLRIVAAHHGLDLDVDRVMHEFVLDAETVLSSKLLEVAWSFKIKARRSKIEWGDLASLDGAFPLIGYLDNGNAVVISGFREENGGEVAITDPRSNLPGFVYIGREKFEGAWSGDVVFLKRIHSFGDEKQPFSLRWFIPEALRQKSAFIHIAVAALSLHVIGLVTPLFFQVVVDKVLIHNSADTLTVLGVGVVLAVVFESVLVFLRNYLLMYATNRIDIRLATKTFDHLVHLPLTFFKNSSAGRIVRHMQQTEQIREFLTGSLFMTFLDAWALLIFLPMLMFYSVTMAGVVVGFSLLAALTVVALMPAFRRELDRLYAAESKRQALLIETIHGAQTVKSLALEPILKHRWGTGSALAITRRMRVGRLSITSHAIIGFLEKLLTVVIVWVGARMVFNGTLSVGELIAIQMLSKRVANPLVALVLLSNEFQQVGLSVRMLGEVMNQMRESTINATMRPPLKGDLTVENLTFYYPGESVPALEGINIRIPAGRVVGIVGRSGSGKSTFLQLLQGLYRPSSGFILFSGVDMRNIDLAYLRQNLGVVLQESFLFHGTVRENISITNPNATFAEIVAAAQMAGAEEFILRLNNGYETMLEENANNLSGGQKQRLSIARALLNRPPIVIFDEATSSLDPESEAIIQGNMDHIAARRTVMVVSHRLAALCRADVILVFENGRIIGQGSHEQLMKTCEAYVQMWDQQHAYLR